MNICITKNGHLITTHGLLTAMFFLDDIMPNITIQLGLPYTFLVCILSW